jgi:1-deoxy-D-xylulose-5-phosphate synthase
VFDLSYLRTVPGLTIAAPADATELCALLETALDLDGPIAIRYPKGTAPATPDLPVEPIPVGRWEELREGKDAAILAVGRMVEVAQVAADRLAEQGISCGVVNARWVKPMDPRLESFARRYPVLLTAEDNVRSGGFGAAVLEALAPAGLAGRVRVAALPDGFLPHGKPAELLAEHGLDPDGLASAVRSALPRLAGIGPRSDMLCARPRSICGAGGAPPGGRGWGGGPSQLTGCEQARSTAARSRRTS